MVIEKLYADKNNIAKKINEIIESLNLAHERIDRLVRKMKESVAE